MLAVWECRSDNRVHIGSYGDLTFSSGTPPTTSRKRRSESEAQSTQKPRILRNATSYDPHQRKKCWKHSLALRRCKSELIFDRKSRGAAEKRLTSGRSRIIVGSAGIAKKRRNGSVAFN